MRLPGWAFLLILLFSTSSMTGAPGGLSDHIPDYLAIPELTQAVEGLKHFPYRSELLVGTLQRFGIPLPASSRSASRLAALFAVQIQLVRFFSAVERNRTCAYLMVPELRSKFGPDFAERTIFRREPYITRLQRVYSGSPRAPEFFASFVCHSLLEIDHIRETDLKRVALSLLDNYLHEMEVFLPVL